MPDISPHVPEGMTAEQRDARVAAENERARIERDLKLMDIEAANAMRVYGYPESVIALVLGDNVAAATRPADDTTFVPVEPGQTGE